MRCRGLVLLVAVFALGVVGAAPAWGARTFLFQESFGPGGSSSSSFGKPAGVAVDQGSGDVYVADLSAGTVERFDSEHHPVPFTGVNANINGQGRLGGFSFYTEEAPLNQLAVDPTTHVFYVTNTLADTVEAFQADGTPAVFTAGPGAGTNKLGLGGLACGVAVDANGDIYASAFQTGVHVFTSSGAALTTFTGLHFACQVAVDSTGGVYRTNSLEGPVFRFAPSEFPVTASTKYTESVFASVVATDVVLGPLSEVFLDEASKIGEYGEAGSLLGVFGGEGSGALCASEGVAVNDASGLVYASDAGCKHQVNVFRPVPVPEVITGEASAVGGHSATLNGTVNPEGSELTECVFEYVEESKFASSGYAGGASVPCVPAAIPTDSNKHAVHAAVSGLSAGTVYHFRLRAENAAASGFGADRTFSTLPAPVIASASSGNETASSAELRASINPGGLPTTYRFEYGTSGYEKQAPAADGSIAATGGEVPVAQTITGLAPNTTYHWRVVASSEAGTTVSPDHTFVYDTSGAELPDGRQYEMVTPAVKNAAAVDGTLLGRIPDVARDGSRVVLSSIQCFGEAQSCPGDPAGINGSSYQFERTPGGWVATSLEPPSSQFGISATRVVDADAPGVGLFSTAAPLSGGNLVEDLYVRGSDGAFSHIGPLVPPEAGTSLALKDVPFATAADFSRIVWEPEHLTTNGEQGFRWPFDLTTGRATLYEYSGAGNREPALVGVSGGPGTQSLISRCSTVLGASGEVATHGQMTALSSDGSVVFFTAVGGPGCFGSGSNEHVEALVDTLYARVDGSETVAISEPSLSYCSSSPRPVPACSGAVFQGASADGSRVFFTSQQQLAAGAVEGSENLYEAELGRNGEGRMVVKGLVAVSRPQSGVGVPGVLGVVAVSSDGSHVYFVASGVLSSEERPSCRASFEAAGVPEEGRCKAQSSGDNLYVYSGGRVAFIARLSSADESLWNEGDLGRANVTPDGRFLVFTSPGLLTADDSNASGAAQVFRYDAVSGGLLRVSLGERGFNDNGNAGSLEAGAHIAQARLVSGHSHAGVPRLDPSMSDDGSFVFFESPVALTPHALNEVQIGREGNGRPVFAQNVYEWAREGAGSCPVGRVEGCVSLISDGHDTGAAQVECLTEAEQSDVCLLGVSTSGRDVFFTSSDRLVAGDTDTQLDVYDARVCGVGGCLRSVGPSGSGCVGEGCRAGVGGVPGVPGVPGALSAGFEGPGNPPVSSGVVGVRGLSRAQRLAAALRVCRRERSRRRRVVCERVARRRFGVVRKAGRARAGARSRRGFGR